MGYLTKWLVEWTKLPTIALTCQMAWQNFGCWLVLISHHASGLLDQTHVFRAMIVAFNGDILKTGQFIVQSNQ